MKTTRYLLLFTGAAGLSAAFFRLLNGDVFTDQLMTMVCGVSLIYGYFTIHKTECQTPEQCAKD